MTIIVTNHLAQNRTRAQKVVETIKLLIQESTFRIGEPYERQYPEETNVKTITADFYTETRYPLTYAYFSLLLANPKAAETKKESIFVSRFSPRPAPQPTWLAATLVIFKFNANDEISNIDFNIYEEQYLPQISKLAENIENVHPKIIMTLIVVP